MNTQDIHVQSYQWCCSGLKIFLLRSVFTEHPCEIVRLTSVTIPVALRALRGCYCYCAARHCVYAILLAPAWDSLMQGGADTHNNLHTNDQQQVCTVCIVTLSCCNVQKNFTLQVRMMKPMRFLSAIASLSLKSCLHALQADITAIV